VEARELAGDAHGERALVLGRRVGRVHVLVFAQAQEQVCSKNKLQIVADLYSNFFLGAFKKISFWENELVLQLEQQNIA